MALAPAHLAVGMAVSFTVALIRYVKHGFRFRTRTITYLPFIMLGCGFWALLPKFINLIGLSGLSKLMQRPVIGDVFFFYALVCRFETQGSLWGMGLMIIMFYSLILVYIKHISDQQRHIRYLRHRIEKNRELIEHLSGE